MKRWQTCLLLLGIGAMLTLADVPTDDKDDGVTVEDEKIENPTPLPSEVLESQIRYQSPYIQSGKYHFVEHFDDPAAFEKKWTRSTAQKEGETVSKYDGEWAIEAPGKPIFRNDLGLVLKSKARHAAIASRLVRPFVFNDRPFIVQYEVQLQDGQECGGSYIKLLSSGPETTDLKTFNDKTPYTIMFGPDKCGNDHKLHFIFRHVNPLNGSIEEKHCRKPKDRIEEPFTDQKPHLYQLVLNPDNTYRITLDHKVINEGSLLTDFTPPVNPPKEINDPNDFKPETWDEREKIPDPTAERPADWDESQPSQVADPNAKKPDGWLDNEEEMVSDPSAVKPADWDNEMDGEWEAPLVANPICEKAVGCGLWKAPLISNPLYRGKWRAPLIDNPNYKGKWAPRRIPNPNFFEDSKPFKMTPISAVGIELWSMSQDILFDNLLITDDFVVAQEWASLTFDLKRKQIDRESETVHDTTMRSINNKPFWWTVYVIYCMIPVVIYAWYLWRRTLEETIVQRVLRITEDKPWLWAVFIFAGALPMTIFIYLRCFAKDKPKRVPHAKKTDQVQADDDEDVDINQSPRPASKASKTDLDEPLASSSVDEEEIEDNDEDDAEEEEESPEPVSSEGARKRKSRKD